MNRKWMTLVLAVVLAVLLPLQALAGMQYTLTIVPGEELAAEPLVSDVCEVAALKLTTGEKSGALTLMLKGKDMATVAVGADRDGLYVNSNLIGAKVLFVSWEEGIAFVSDFLKSTLESQGMLDEQTAEMMDTAMNELKASIQLAWEDGAQLEATVKPEEAIALLEEAYADDPGMVAYLKNILEKLQEEEGAFTAETHDAATCRQTLQLTTEDILLVFETNYMRSMLEQSMQAQDPELTGEKLTAAVDAAIEEAREIFKSSDVDMVMTVYSANEHQDVVGVEMEMDISVTEGGETETVLMTMQYDRLTTAEGVGHKALLEAKYQDTSLMEMSLDLNFAENGEDKGMFALLAEGGQLSVVYNAADKTDAREHSVALYFRDGAASIVEPAASERPLITFYVAEKEADPAVLADIDSATSETAVNILGLSNAGMMELMNEIQNQVQQVMINLFSNLPSSVLQMFMQ